MRILNKTFLKMNHLQVLLLAILCVFPLVKSQASPLPTRINLKVALFPWIPDAAGDDFKALLTNLERMFEKEHPYVDLELTLKQGGFYEHDTLAMWLREGTYDVVEIDTVMLEGLVQENLLLPWEKPNREVFDAAYQGAVDIKSFYGEVGSIQGNAKVDTWWGMPHLLCGYFLFTRDKTIALAEDIGDLTKATTASGLPFYGKLSGSWDLTAVYIDAAVDNGLPPTFSGQSLTFPLNQAALKALDAFGELCGDDNKNPCTDGTFAREFDQPALDFAAGKAAAFWGYSERLHIMVNALKANGQPTDGIFLNTIPLGSRAVPLFFVDAFVQRIGLNQAQEKKFAAELFVEFMLSDRAYGQVLMSRDAGPNAVPRYLLPAIKDVSGIQGMRDDVFYNQLLPLAEVGSALPIWSDIPDKREAVSKRVSKAIEP